MTYASYTDFTNFYNTSYSQDRVEEMLSWATLMVDKFTGKTFTTASTTDVFYGDGYKKKFILNSIPVVSVTSAIEYDYEDTATTRTISHFDSNSGFIVLNDAVTDGNRITFTYVAGDTANAPLAKLLCIHLTQIGLSMFKKNGGVFPNTSVRKGDIAYSFGGTSENNDLLMNVWSLIDVLKRKIPTVLGKGDGVYESYR